jgi:predicted DNA-binding transcriptional regulator YafY
LAQFDLEFTVSLERRLAIISLIPREPRSITANEVTAKLNHELDIPSELRTVQRDLLELSDVDALGLRFYEGEERTQPPSTQLALPVGRNCKNKKSNQTKRWYISKVISGMEIPSMDPSAATVLKLAEKYLHGLLPGAVLENINHYFQRASAVLNKPGRPRGWLDAVAMVPKSLPLLPPTYDRSLASTVFQSIKDNRQLRVSSITRLSPDAPKEYDINPLGIVLRDTSIYLVWTRVGDTTDHIKEFVLHRLRTATILDIPRDLPVGFSLDEFIHEQQGFGYLVQDEPETIQLVLDVDPTLRLTLSETALSGDQTIEQLSERRYRVTATVKNTHQLRAWIMEKSPQLRVVAPTSLRQAILGLIKQALQQYQSVV